MLHQNRAANPAGTIDLSSAAIVVPPDISGPEQKAVAMLVDEVEKRTHIRWACTTKRPTEPRPEIVVGQISALPALAGAHATALASGEATAPEGYRLHVVAGDTAPAVFVLGHDARGVLYGVGRLLRSLRLRTGQALLPADLNITTAPAYRLRGHQLGFRDKTNSYCGWDLPQWEQYYRDLIVFGVNAIELMPPRTDDNADSVHFPRPPLEMMAGMSRLADEYGLDVWVWYPAMDPDYSAPATVEFALQEWAEVFRALPRIDAIFVPGGDPGHTHPQHLMALLEKQTASLHRFHPQAQLWVAPQGFTGEWMEEFLRILREQSPDWLTGVVVGPQIHTTTDQFRKWVPERYAIRNYPDITHSYACQYPVPDWDVAYAMTEGRESINPRPLDQATIFRHSQASCIGFLTYSEGCNDDVNKFIWCGLGWDPEQKVIDILHEYSHYFIGERYADDFAQGLLALERNWQGPLACNTGVYTTLQQFQAMEASASPRDLKNWRFQQALYRAYYDAYVRSRLLYESSLEDQAMDQLRQAPHKGSSLALAEAERILDLAVNQPVSQDWRTRIFQLAEALFQSIHMQLSVPLYRAQAELRGANLDGVDNPLSNRPWLKERFAELRTLSDEAQRLAGIQTLLQWANPGPGGFYDDLSNSFSQPHLIHGPGFQEDPAFLRSALRHYEYRKSPGALRQSWRCQTGSLNDAAFEMRYRNLDPVGRYRVRIVYSDASPHIRVRLEANQGIEVHPFIERPAPRRPVEFDIPPAATQGGDLTLRWCREPGRGGTGRGCQVSEVWLLKLA